MRWYFLLALSGLIFSHTPLLTAQSNPLLKQGESAYYGRQYTDALEKLNECLTADQNLAERDRVKALYFRGMTYYHITSDRNLLNQFPEAFAQAFRDLNQVIKLDTKGNYQILALKSINTLQPYLKENAINRINLAYRRDLRPEERNTYAIEARKFINILIETEPDIYLHYDLRAQAQLIQKDSLAALLDFQNASKLYTEHLPETPDFLIAYAFYRSAIIQRFSLKDLKKALGSIRGGLRLITSEYQRLQNQSNPTATLQYKNAKQDLENFELDIYLQSEEVFPDALSRFERALEEDPNNYNKRCAYAGFLERVDPEAAIEQYKLAIKINPKQKLAPFNLAAIYINQSASTLKIADEKAGIEQFEKLQETSLERARMALPYLEQSHEADPQDRQILQALLNLCLRLEENDRYNRYKAKLQQLNGY